MPPTIVSAYVDLDRTADGVKSAGDYIRHSSPLMNLDHPKIIFLEPHVIERIEGAHSSTRIIPFSKDDLFFKLDGIKLPLNANADKDTRDYFSIQLNKTDWIMKASETKKESNQFVWVDFGISHVCPNIDFSRFKNEHDKIRVPGCWNPMDRKGISLDYPNWFFCGGLFGGNINKIKTFDFLVKEYAGAIIKSGKITWEVNIWKIIHDDHPDLFDWYYADHDCGMINNY